MVEVLEILIRANLGTHGADLEAEDHAANGAKSSKNCNEVISVTVSDGIGFIKADGQQLEGSCLP